MSDLPISGLPVVTALSSSYLIPAVSGSVTAQMTLAQVGAAISGSYVTVDGTQTIAGSKTFSANQLTLAPASSGGVLNLKQDAYLGSTNGYTSLASDGTNIAIIAANGAITNKQAVLDLSSLTNNTLRTYTFPNKNGTVAMLSDITSSDTTFPYTGSAIISGSLGLTGSINLSGSINDGLGVTRYSWDGYNNSFNGTLYVSGSITDPINPYAYSTFNEGLITDGIYVGTSWKGEDNTTVGAGAWAVAPRFSGGSGNTLMGYNVLNNSFSASFNVVMGAEAGRLLFWGNDNVALGYQSMVTASGVNSSNRTNSNIAIGTRTLRQARFTSGSIAVGYEALSAISSSVLSQRNTAIGYQAGAAITSGSYNTILGGWTGSTSISNAVVLADGQGNRAFYHTGSTIAIGTYAMQNYTSGSNNIAIGVSASLNLTTGTGNVALGYGTLRNATTAINNIAINGANNLTTGNRNIVIGGINAGATTGDNNVAVGYSALLNVKAGTGNAAVGYAVFSQTITGSYNTGLGYFAGHNSGLISNDVGSGSYNIALGYFSLVNQTNGDNNIAMGAGALYGGDVMTQTAAYNIAIGYSSSYSMTSGIQNVTIGNNAGGGSLQTGTYNVAIGTQAMGTGSGDYNVAIGAQALPSASSGFNVAVGAFALLSAGAETGVNTAIGAGALYRLTSGQSNTAIGLNAMSSGNGTGNVAIGDNTLNGFNTGSWNTVVGTATMQQNKSGSYNFVFGSGWNQIITGSFNTLIGGGGGTSTMNNTIIIADGASNVGYKYSGSKAEITGSLNLTNVLTLAAQHPLPAASSFPNSFAVSASSPTKPYYSDGTNWNALY